MKKSAFENSLLDFHMSMSWDIDLLVKIQLARRVIKSLEEKRSIFEAFVFSICANWEILVEELMIDCLNRDTSRYAEYTGFKLPKNISRETCKAVVIGIGYIDFKSVGHLQNIARQILIPQCNPFSKITAAQGKKIDEFFIIRNYLAHYSHAARRSLLRVYKDVYGITRFVQPGVFLLGQEKGAQMPRMGIYINNFEAAAHKMEDFLGIKWE